MTLVLSPREDASSLCALARSRRARSFARDEKRTAVARDVARASRRSTTFTDDASRDAACAGAPMPHFDAARARAPSRADDRGVDARRGDTVTVAFARRARELAASLALQSSLRHERARGRRELGPSIDARARTRRRTRSMVARGGYSSSVAPPTGQRVPGARVERGKDAPGGVRARTRRHAGSCGPAMEARLVRERSVVVHRVTRNAPLNSFDGVEAGARRLVEELREVKEKYPICDSCRCTK